MPGYYMREDTVKLVLYFSYMLVKKGKNGLDTSQEQAGDLSKACKNYSELI